MTNISNYKLMQYVKKEMQLMEQLSNGSITIEAFFQQAEQLKKRFGADGERIHKALEKQREQAHKKFKKTINRLKERYPERATSIGWQEYIAERDLKGEEIRQNEAVAKIKLLGAVTQSAIIRISLCEENDRAGLDRIRDVADRLREDVNNNRNLDEVHKFIADTKEMNDMRKASKAQVNIGQQRPR